MSFMADQTYLSLPTNFSFPIICRVPLTVECQSGKILWLKLGLHRGIRCPNTPQYQSFAKNIVGYKFTFAWIMFI